MAIIIIVNIIVGCLVGLTGFECVNKGDIIHSMVDGKWIMRDRKITTIDEDSVREELKKWLSL